MSTATLKAQTLMPTLTVNDLESSIRLYTEGLGFELIDKYESDGKLEGVMLGAGEAKLGLSQDDFGKGRDRVKGVGLRFYLETEQDVRELARQAKATGWNLEGEAGPLPWGPVGFTVTDPDGFKLTIANPS